MSIEPMQQTKLRFAAEWQALGRISSYSANSSGIEVSRSKEPPHDSISSISRALLFCIRCIRCNLRHSHDRFRFDYQNRQRWSGRPPFYSSSSLDFILP